MREFQAQDCKWRWQESAGREKAEKQAQLTKLPVSAEPAEVKTAVAMKKAAELVEAMKEEEEAAMRVEEFRRSYRRFSGRACESQEVGKPRRRPGMAALQCGN